MTLADGRTELRFSGPERAFAGLIRGVRTMLQEAKGESVVALTVQATFPEPLPWRDERLDRLARDLDDTYRCAPVGVKAVWRRR